MAAVFASLTDVVRMVETGALEIRTPDDNDPALVTMIQIDGDIVCSIYARRLAKLVAAGEALDVLAARHRDAMAERLGAMTTKILPLSHRLAFMVSLGIWGAGGIGFAAASDLRLYVWSVVMVPLLHWGARRLPGFALRWAIPILRRRVLRDIRTPG